MALFYDQLNRVIELNSFPQRIVSIVPSQTELLFDLDLDQEIIGITKYCNHPADKVGSKIKVGGTKQLNIPLIKQLQPDLIIANKEENEQSQIKEIMCYFPVWISDITTLSDAYKMIASVGEFVNKSNEAQKIIHNIDNKFEKLSIAANHKKVAYFIWRKPYMIAANNTFINDMLLKCGFKNAFELTRYPELTEQDIINAEADVVLLSSEPYPFKEKHIKEFQQLLPNAVVKLVDGEMFSWYGSRLQYAPDYFAKLIDQLNLKS
jgi:ABC-type Fe3+-hydroxamate transport system substrate-binding protein